MDETCKPRITAHCEGETVVEAKEAGSCPVWDTCLPFGGHLYSDGGCVHFEPGTPPPDGTYGTIKIVDGCIVDLGPVRPPLYTEANCADVPASCAGGSGSGSGSCSVSTQAGNMLDTDVAGNLVAKLYTEASESMAFSGDGTADNPLKVSMLAGAATTKVTATAPISVTGKDNVYDVSHRKGQSLTLNGMEFDAWGHLVAYSVPPDSANSPIAGIIGDALSGIEAKADTPSAGIYTISLSSISGSDTSAQLGGYELSIDKYGRVTGATRNILCPAAEFEFGEYLVTVNQFGSITNIRKNEGSKDDDDPDASYTGFARSLLVQKYEESFRFKPKSSARLLIRIEGEGITNDQILLDIDGDTYQATKLHNSEWFCVTGNTYAGGVFHTMRIYTGPMNDYITTGAPSLMTVLYIS